MSVVIIYSRADGGTSVVAPAPGVDINLVVQKDVPSDATKIMIVGLDKIPSDRTFRNAWKDTGSKIGVDMPKAREIWREKMRRARKPKLEALDIEYQRADELGDNAKKSQIVAKKRQLRDVTDLPEIEAAKTPDELKAVWPSELGNV